MVPRGSQTKFDPSQNRAIDELPFPTSQVLRGCPFPLKMLVDFSFRAGVRPNFMPPFPAGIRPYAPSLKGARNLRACNGFPISRGEYFEHRSIACYAMTSPIRSRFTWAVSWNADAINAPAIGRRGALSQAWRTSR